MVNVNEIVDVVVSSITVDGNVDFDALKEVISDLQKFKKEMKEVADAQAKEAKEAKKAENAEIGKAYVETLAAGSDISYTMADGTVVNGTLVKFSDKTATIQLPDDSPLLVGKNTERRGYNLRYVKFDKVVVAAEVASEMVA